MRAAFLGLCLLANKLWRMHGSVSWSQWVWMQWQWGGVWEQLCRLETVNNRELSYYTFCCSVSPDSLSFSLPSASHSFSFTSHIRLSLSPYPTHTPTYLPLCMCNHTLLPRSLTPPRLSSLSALLFPAPSPKFPATTLTTISSFLPRNCAHFVITPQPHMYKHTHPAFPRRSKGGRQGEVTSRTR